MFADERRAEIVRLVDEKNSVTVAFLSAEFGTSEVTIRRDLQELETEGLLKRTHGGAIKINNLKHDLNIFELNTKQVEEKSMIAKKAYSLINDGDSIILDPSSTAGMITKYLKSGSKSGITVVTNSFRVVFDLLDCDNVEVIHVGGQLIRSFESSVGIIAESTLSTLNVDKAFIGINGIDFNAGLTTINLYESKIKSMMLECGRETYILADNTKFNKTHLSVVRGISNVKSTIITDNDVSDDTITKLNDNEISYIVA
jgi:DeoR family fructose operon transcriptional repressor